MINNTRKIQEFIIKNLNRKYDIAVDMTCGNGNDSKNIIESLRPKKLYCLDIQQEAVDNTKKMIKSHIEKKLIDIRILKENHKYINKYLEENIDFAVYNLGYLPGGNKKITTIGEDVVISLEILMNCLNCGGLILITLYPGHIEGNKEKDTIMKFLEKQDQREYNIIKYEFINQINSPPFVISIEKSK